MQVYRITKQKYRGDLSGKGAELFGGRWNPVGIPALYTSENRALCALELLVHTPKEILPPKYVLLTLDIPIHLVKDIVTIQIKDLDKNWDSIQSDEYTEKIGFKYFQQLNSFGLRVPSTVIKQENNIILNPKHENYKDITIIEEVEFNIDDRLLK